MTTHDCAAEAWRDLTDQLTAGEVANIAELEQSLLANSQKHAWVAQFSLAAAKEAIEYAEIDRSHEHIEPPSGASVDFWEKEHDGVGVSRSVTWAEMGYVAVDGRQYGDGRVERAISLYCGDGATLAVDAARQLVADLSKAIDSAEELDLRP